MKGACQESAGNSPLFVTHILVDLQRKLVIVTEIGDGKLMPICSRVCDFVHRWGTGTVDGGIWEAREVLGSHQLGTCCRAGVSVRSWGIDGPMAGCGYRFA